MWRANTSRGSIRIEHRVSSQAGDDLVRRAVLDVHQLKQLFGADVGVRRPTSRHMMWQVEGYIGRQLRGDAVTVRPREHPPHSRDRGSQAWPVLGPHLTMGGGQLPLDRARRPNPQEKAMTCSGRPAHLVAARRGAPQAPRQAVGEGL
jgi:hypothetical protein